jgi:queuine/archaeosine tRNA-ribosyltransferase
MFIIMNQTLICLERKNKMLKISGTSEEIKRIKSALWFSCDCPLCSNPERMFKRIKKLRSCKYFL